MNLLYSVRNLNKSWTSTIYSEIAL